MSEKKMEMGWSDALGEHVENPSTPRKQTDNMIFDVLGNDWMVSVCESRIKGQFERWVRQRSLKEVAEIERESGPEEGRLYRSIYLEDRTAGHFNWLSNTGEEMGAAIRKAIQDSSGLVYLFYLLLRRCHPTVTEKDALEIFKADPAQCSMAVMVSLGNSSAPLEVEEPKEPKETSPIASKRRHQVVEAEPETI
jgi:hypothetical protein